MVFSTRTLALSLGLLTISTLVLPGIAAARSWAPLVPAAGGGSTGSTGSSHVTVNGACVPAARAACQGMTTWKDGEFRVLGASRATLVATWRSACMGCAQMNVYVGGIAAKTGTSPVTLDLGTLQPGTYAVGVFFGGPVVGSARQDVSWTVTYG